MTLPAPPIDRRRADEIVVQLRALLAQNYTKGNWPNFDPDAGLSAALTAVFGRLAEIVIQRLNQAPQKNFLAFLDLLGASRMPPQAAQTPLVFELAPGTTSDALVPAGTKIAAALAPGETTPAVFETDRELNVAAATLACIYARYPQRDRRAAFPELLAAGVAQGCSVFAADPLREVPLEHQFYVGRAPTAADLAAGAAEFTLGAGLYVELAQALPAGADARAVVWEFWDGAQWQILTLTVNQLTPQMLDGTNNLQQSGLLEFSSTGMVARGFTIPGIDGVWLLRCRLLTPIVPDGAAVNAAVRAAQLPGIASLTSRTGFTRQVVVDAAFAGSAALDLTQDSFPFGERPRFGDVLYLGSREGFSRQGLQLTLSLGPSASFGWSFQSLVTFHWEFWNGRQWIALGDTSQLGASAFPGVDFHASTAPFVYRGGINFTLPEAPQPTRVNGVENYWLRITLRGGAPGSSALVSTDPPGGIPPAGLPSIAPPTIEYDNSLYEYRGTPYNDSPMEGCGIPVTPGLRVVSLNDGVYEDHNSPADSAFTPFRPSLDLAPTLYFGLQASPGRNGLGARKLSFYVVVADIPAGTRPDGPAAVVQPLLAWEYWNGSAWTVLAVDDGTRAFTRSGPVEFLPPPDFVPRTDFDAVTAWWIRARLDSGSYEFLPRLCRVLFNCTLASHASTVSDEVLGSSDHSESQSFATVGKPILAGSTQLQVREPELPGAAERAVLESEEGADAIEIDAGGGTRAIWVRWHEVPNFYASGPRDRHYVLDALAGRVLFGDGGNGLIPPQGAGNVRMARYRSGGGVAGNRAPGSITQLQTTVPYVASVVHPLPASGGTEAETVDELIERAPRELRHRGRAATVDDFHDLAIEASPEVARALSVPLFDLVANPDAMPDPDRPGASPPLQPGWVSMIVVPRSLDARPAPDAALISVVGDYLRARACGTVDVAVVGPDYCAVTVDTELSLAALDGAAAVADAAQAALDTYLHPLTGGPEGRGWAFGTQPTRAHLFAMLEALPGVDHVARLQVAVTPDRGGANLAAGRFLVYSGRHRIQLRYERR